MVVAKRSQGYAYKTSSGGGLSTLSLSLSLPLSLSLTLSLFLSFSLLSAFLLGRRDTRRGFGFLEDRTT